MRHSLYVKRDDEWLTAPWNDGAGGRYSPIPAEAVAWANDVYDETEDYVEAGTGFFLGVYEEDILGELIPLMRADKSYRAGCLVVADPESSQEIVFDEYEPDWCRSLVDGPTKLAVAELDDALVLVWLDDGGRDAWEGNRRTRELRSRLVKKHNSEDYFINPYSFVPLPPSVTRTRPGGHEALGADSVSGWFDWNLTCKTEFLLPHEEASAIQNEVLDYPGSSLRGALRSLHETMSGGCMRVVDGSFRPVHREPMNAYKSATDRLAVVTQIDPVTHAVTEVGLADEVHWVDHKALKAKLPGGLYSGRRLAVDTSGAVWSSVKKRSEITNPAAISPRSPGSPEWVMHITDSPKPRQNHPYYVAVGLPTRVHDVSAAAWRRFVEACDGCRDLVSHPSRDDSTVNQHGTPIVPGTGPWTSVEVKHKRDGLEELIGHRRRVDGWLGIGDTVWVTGQGELKMAAIWRKHGQYSVEERMGKDLLPCSDPENLCPSCSVFGSIKAERTAEHEQAAYRTHIQAGWAKSVSPQDGSPLQRVTSTAKTLPPLRSPQPSSGGFYLEAPAKNSRSAGGNNENHVQRSHWYDQRNESGERRRVRGRKFYWHGQSPGGRQTQWTHDQTQNGSAHAVPAGTVLRARITFDNLSPEQLGWLLAAADPKRLFESECVIHLGGGKPLGYGTAEPRIENLHLETAAQRYGSVAASSPDQRADEAIRLVRGLVEERQLSKVHAALKHLLSPHAVHADRVNYPTAESFSARGSREFDRAFNWFGMHSGGREGNLVPLPDAADPDQYLSIGTEDQEGKR